MLFFIILLLIVSCINFLPFGAPWTIRLSPKSCLLKLAARKKVVSIDIDALENIVSDSNSESLSSIVLRSGDLDGISVDFIPKGAIVRRLVQSQIPRRISSAILVSANDALKQWSIVFADCGFLSASQQFDIRNIFDDIDIAGLRLAYYGGYAQAERCRLAFYKEEFMNFTEHDSRMSTTAKFCYIQIAGNFIFEKFTIEEFRSILLGICGVDDSLIGDILSVGNTGGRDTTGFQVVVDPSVSIYMICKLQNCTIGSVPVTARIINADELSVRPPVVKEVRKYL